MKSYTRIVLALAACGLVVLSACSSAPNPRADFHAKLTSASHSDIRMVTIDKYDHAVEALVQVGSCDVLLKHPVINPPGHANLLDDNIVLADTGWFVHDIRDRQLLAVPHVVKDQDWAKGSPNAAKLRELLNDHGFSHCVK